MDYEILAQLVSNVGFPIAAFAAMFYMCNTTIKDINTSINQLTKSIDNLLDKEKENG
jgi:hypothetical protein